MQSPKSKYIAPTIETIVQQRSLMETMSGSDQGWGNDPGIPRRTKDAIPDFDFDNEQSPSGEYLE